jgi:predicted GIY-YIG superfamily endonuclease
VVRHFPFPPTWPADEVFDPRFWTPHQLVTLQRAWQNATPLDWGGMILRPDSETYAINARTTAHMGIYVLTEADGHILYVGLSNNIPMRIMAHWKKGAIPFARYAFQPVPEYAIEEVEMAHIHALEPEYNISYQGRGTGWPQRDEMVKAIRMLWYGTTEPREVEAV